MRRIWKRNLVLLTVVVFVGAAAYLNYDYSASEEASKVLGQSSLVDGVKEEESTETVAKASDYFDTARLTRQEARDSAKTLLEEAAAKEGATKEVLDQASKGIQALAEFTMSESTIENLVTAKGYKECVAFLSDKSVSVVVDAGDDGLGSTDVVKITDIVMEETGFTADQIKIMEAN